MLCFPVFAFPVQFQVCFGCFSWKEIAFCVAHLDNTSLSKSACRCIHNQQQPLCSKLTANGNTIPYPNPSWHLMDTLGHPTAFFTAAEYLCLKSLTMWIQVKLFQHFLLWKTLWWKTMMAAHICLEVTISNSWVSPGMEGLRPFCTTDLLHHQHNLRSHRYVSEAECFQALPVQFSSQGFKDHKEITRQSPYLKM